MSQAGIVDIIGTHPEIPTMFVANVGTAVPIANTIELLGAAVAAHGVPLQTVASGNTVDFNIQYASAAASSVAGNAGVASFDSTRFSVDANGYVILTGGATVESFTVDASTPPGTNPVVSNGSGIVTVTGGQVAAGTTANVIRTDSLAANTYTIEIQRSQAVAVSTVGDNGVSHFNSTYFTVDSNGFVSLNGSGVGETITGNTGGALSPTAGNWNILGTGSLTSAGAASTLTFSLTGLTNHNVLVGAGTATITNVPPSTAGFVLTSNGAAADPSFQDISASGAIKTITGNSGGAESPTAGGNFNILGTGSITVAGSANTETVQLTGLTNHNVLIGAGTATITNVAPSATSGVPLISQGAAADPAFGTAVVAGGGTGTSSFNINGPVIASTTTTGALSSITLTNQKFLVGNTSAAPTAKGLSINVQVFTSSGTYTPTSGMLYCIVECQGGGGGGGGAAATGASTVAAGGGGGGGGYARKTVSAATIGASQTVTIGAGGTAGSSSGGNGGNGTTTSLGAIISALGGVGGSGGAAGTNCFSGGGSPSTGSGGDVNCYGTGGGWGWGTFATLSAMGGTGGASALGGGAQSVIANGSGGNPGQGGGPYGGGGSGASLSTSQGGGAGGAGGAGIMIITEYVLA